MNATLVVPIQRLAALALGLLLALGGVPSDATAAELEGQVTLTKRGRPTRESASAVVYFVPDEGKTFDAPAEPFEITMVNKQFSPQTLVVPVGSTVHFPNEDTILHNVFSVSGRNRFDLGLYRRGAGKSAVFEYPGVVRVFCNVHHAMVAYVVVADSPHITTADDDGRFRLSDLSAGPGTLHVWHPRAAPWSGPVILPKDSTLSVELEIDKPLVPRHQNKDGKPYARRRGSNAYDN